ncbi:MAG: M56 family metallopeptidase [Sphingomicrobium sp.]
MEWLFPIAAKSFLVTGVALLLLNLASKRSAAQRSWIAHLGLLATLLLPVAAIALPPIEVRAPAFLAPPATDIAPAPAVAPVAVAPVPTAKSKDKAKFDKGSAAAADTFPAASGAIEAARNVDWAFWIYLAPAALLILLTLIALGRLVSLRGRANVLVEAHWLTALARAQRRMGFKHGTALLTSDELPSPISWGLMRPVILLNSAAAESHKEAEAIIAHELAHVANLDWIKLLLARFTVALFWFNPLVWLLAREAHQLREEAADDAVLGADIDDTDYANLLVGVARHECRGLLIGAHGVAPGRNSLSRRVRRVLDTSLTRGPVGRAFALGMFAGAGMLAAPLAALTLTNKPAAAATERPRPAALASVSEPREPYYTSSAVAPSPATQPVAAAQAAVAAAARAVAAVDPAFEAEHERAVGALERAQDARDAELEAVNDQIDDAVETALESSRDAIAGARISVSSVQGVTPQYAAAIRAASPRLAQVGTADLVALKIHGVSPAYVRELEASGLRGLSPGEITSAAIQGVDGRFLRSMAAVGYPRLSLQDAIAMRIQGVTPEFVRSLQKRGSGKLSPRDVIRLRIVGPGARRLTNPGPMITIEPDDEG